MYHSRFRFLKVVSLLPLVCFFGVAQATLIEFKTILSGATESPPNASAGTGSADMFYDDVLHTLEMNINFSGLTGLTTASHIHAATALPGVGNAGVATQTPTFAGFPPGVAWGFYYHIFDLTLASSFNAAYVTAQQGSVSNAETALITAMIDGKAYLNIHTTVFPGGEIRGFLAQVPDGASTASLLGLSLVGLIAFARSQRSKSAHS